MLHTGNGFFDGIPEFPREHSSLLQHENHLRYTLQRHWFISPEVMDLALRPDKSEEFNSYYQEQVRRIVGHFNTVTRSQLKVRVNPRLPKGMQLMRNGGAAPPLRSVKNDTKNVINRSAPFASSTAAVTGSSTTTTVAKTSLMHNRRQEQLQHQRLLQQQVQSSVQGNAMPTHPKYKAESLGVSGATHTNGDGFQSQVEGHQTPQTAASSQQAMMMRGGYTATDGKATVSSYDGSTSFQSSSKKSCREVLFTTPPEFKGFTAPLEASPADSLVGKSPLLF